MHSFFFQLWTKLHSLLFPASPIFYMGSGRTMPPPLSPSEEAELLRRYPDPEVQEILIERNLRLVVYLARKYESSGTPMEDLVSIGTIGLIKAIRTFRPEKKIKLATYASRCISNEILMHLRKISPLRGEVSLDDPLNVDGDGNELLLSDILGTEEDLTERPLEERSEREMLRNAISHLPSRERTIISLRFGMNIGRELTQKEVADQMGISQSYISRLEKKIVAKLRRELEKTMNT